MEWFGGEDEMMNSQKAPHIVLPCRPPPPAPVDAERVDGVDTLGSAAPSRLMAFASLLIFGGCGWEAPGHFLSH